VIELDQRQAVLGHVFQRPELLKQAFTHRSFPNESGEGSPHNEQFEFLGDAILGFLVSARLVEAFPNASEGQLSKVKAHLVSATHLFEVATRLDLAQYLLLGRGEEKSGGRSKRAKLADAVEAVIAALYLDGGTEAARQFVVRHVIADELDQGLAAIVTRDHKSALQELAGARHLPQPRYRLIEERGPAHRQVFVVEVQIGDDVAAIAEGVTKKSAEQAAAKAALSKI
jgi:ribonuclease-3